MRRSLKYASDDRAAETDDGQRAQERQLDILSAQGRGARFKPEPRRLRSATRLIRPIVAMLPVVVAFVLQWMLDALADRFTFGVVHLLSRGFL